LFLSPAYISVSLFSFQDEDFVADKDDSGSPTDDSGEEESDANDSGGEKEVVTFRIFCSKP
jgi:hypothetical protein